MAIRCTHAPARTNTSESTVHIVISVYPLCLINSMLNYTVILFAGSALDSFQCLRSLLIVSFHVFFGLPRPRCPTTSNSVMLLIQPSFLTTCPNQRSPLYRNKVCMLLIPSFLRRESELMWSFKSKIIYEIMRIPPLNLFRKGIIQLVTNIYSGLARIYLIMSLTIFKQWY